MEEQYDWPAFYAALCTHGPELLDGLDDEVRDLVAAIASSGDEFWSDGLESALAEGATTSDLRAGVLAALDTWRANVLDVLAGDYGIELDPGEVQVIAASPAVDALTVAAATEDD